MRFLNAYQDVQARRKLDKNLKSKAMSFFNMKLDLEVGDMIEILAQGNYQISRMI